MAKKASNLLVYKRRNRASKWREEEENKYNEQSSDRISDLPDDILHHMLSFLPIKSIAQTSLLSKRWTCLWTSFPILDFSEVRRFREPNDNISTKEILQLESKLMEEFISTVLSRRHENSNIKVFRVRGHLMSCSCLDDCIRRVVKHRVEELELQMMDLIDRFDLPLCVFECDSLRSLTLVADGDFFGESRFGRFGFPCSYVGATSAIGLRSLHTLSLICVEFLDSANSVVDLFSVSTFPCLASLTLGDCNGISHLKITCPNLNHVVVFRLNLNSLDIYGMRLKNLLVTDSFLNNDISWVNIFAPNLQNFEWSNNAITEKCSIQSFPNLRKSSIHRFGFHPARRISMTKFHSALDLLSGSSQVQNLYVNSGYLPILSKVYFEGGLPYSFMKLKTLQIATYLDECHIPGIACLLKSSPMVNTLTLKMFGSVENEWNNVWLEDAHYTEEQYWESQAQALSPFLGHLKVVNIVDLTNVNNSMIDVARFLFKHGRGLQEMIFSSPYAKNLSLLKDNIGLIEGFPRASADVKISVT